MAALGAPAVPHRPRAGRGDKARSLLLHRPSPCSAPWQGKDVIQLTRIINKALCMRQQNPAWEHLCMGSAGSELMLPQEHHPGTMGSPIPHPQGRSHSLPTQHSRDANAAAKARLILFKLRM